MATTAVPGNSLATQVAALSLALRIGVASSICLVISEWWQLGSRALSVFTVHIAMVMFPYSAFQKAVERLAGRLLGVAYGLALVYWLRDAPILLIALMMFGQTLFFYVYSTGHLAYACLMGGLFLGLIIEKGLAAPNTVGPYTVSLVEQLVLAMVVIVIINGLSGAEVTLTIQSKGEPLWPIRNDYLSKALMVNTAQTLSMLLCIWLGLPALPTMVSTTILGLTVADPVAMLKKSHHRMWGAVIAGAYSFVAIILLKFMPYVTLLVALLFFGMFTSAYLTKVSTTYSYLFMQVGLATPMVLIGMTGEIGTVETAIRRFEGVIVGCVIAEATLLSWPRRGAVSARN